MRGRHGQPDEIKAIRGNPGKRKLGPGSRRFARGSAPSAAEIMPGFLTEDRERELFTRVVDEYLQRRIARASDAFAYARYCVWLNRWWTCKEALDHKSTFYISKSHHGELARRLPTFKDMLDIERVLQSQEDRLGLNVVSRQAIVRGLAAMPAALGGLFGDEPPAADTPVSDKLPGDGEPLPTVEDRPPSPIGLLN